MDELTAKDLMIGDYVIRKNVPKEILIVDAIDSIRDILVTEENSPLDIYLPFMHEFVIDQTKLK